MTMTRNVRGRTQVLSSPSRSAKSEKRLKWMMSVTFLFFGRRNIAPSVAKTHDSRPSQSQSLPQSANYDCQSQPMINKQNRPQFNSENFSADPNLSCLNGVLLFTLKHRIIEWPNGYVAEHCRKALVIWGTKVQSPVYTKRFRKTQIIKRTERR